MSLYQVLRLFVFRSQNPFFSLNKALVFALLSPGTCSVLIKGFSDYHIGRVKFSPFDDLRLVTLLLPLFFAIVDVSPCGKNGVVASSIRKLISFCMPSHR